MWRWGQCCLLLQRWGSLEIVHGAEYTECTLHIIEKKNSTVSVGGFVRILFVALSVTVTALLEGFFLCLPAKHSIHSISHKTQVRT